MPTRPTRKAEVTRLLKEWQQGRAEAVDLLLPLVYDELRRMARVQLARERRRNTMQATELVHEAFIRLVDQKAGWQNRLHFFGIAAQCMRRILIDRARKKQAAKRPPAGGEVDPERVHLAQSDGAETLLAIDEALQRIARESPRQAQVAELRLFGGLEIAEIALAVGVSEATVKRDWVEVKKVVGDAIRT